MHPQPPSTGCRGLLFSVNQRFSRLELDLANYLKIMKQNKKQFNLKFNSLNIHVFKFAFSCLLSCHTAFKTPEMRLLRFFDPSPCCIALFRREKTCLRACSTSLFSTLMMDLFVKHTSKIKDVVKKTLIN